MRRKKLIKIQKTPRKTRKNNKKKPSKTKQTKKKKTEKKKKTLKQTNRLAKKPSPKKVQKGNLYMEINTLLDPCYKCGAFQIPLA